MRELSLGAIPLTVAFLRTVAPLMTQTDLDIFKEVCDRLLSGTATMDDVVKLWEMENKFLEGM
jgi:hypothetical protein